MPIDWLLHVVRADFDSPAAVTLAAAVGGSMCATTDPKDGEMHLNNTAMHPTLNTGGTWTLVVGQTLSVCNAYNTNLAEWPMLSKLSGTTMWNGDDKC